MKTPESLVPAIDCGIIEEVVRPLMSGKEAQIYIVVANGVECAAKVYKEASQRTFKHRAEYMEGRRGRNSRDQRAMSKRSRHGRKQDEAGWRNTEVDMIYRLRDAGVRVPEPINFVDGVLVMELVKDAEGDPAPRLGDLRFEPDEACELYRQLLREVVRMLCAGVIHGDLSDFNVLLGADGPVVIDFPQALDAAQNQSARKFLLRDVENLHRFVERHVPDPPTRRYAEEMWSLYEANRLDPETELMGDYRPPETKANTGEVLALIEEADFEERERRIDRGEEPLAEVVRPEAEGAKPEAEAVKPLRTVVDFTQEARPRSGAGRPENKTRGLRAKKGARSRSAENTGSQTGSTAEDEGRGAPRKRRSRRRRSGASAAPGEEVRAEPSTRKKTSRKRPAASARSSGENRASTGSDQTSADSGQGSPRSGQTSAGSKQPAGAKRSRGRRRGGSRAGSGDKEAGAASTAKRPTKADARPQGGGSSGPADGGDRPARRRRRRRRGTGSSDPS